jgi:hypothetical protein
MPASQFIASRIRSSAPRRCSMSEPSSPHRRGIKAVARIDPHPRLHSPAAATRWAPCRTRWRLAGVIIMDVVRSSVRFVSLLVLAVACALPARVLPHASAGSPRTTAAVTAAGPASATIGVEAGRPQASARIRPARTTGPSGSFQLAIAPATFAVRAAGRWDALDARPSTRISSLPSLPLFVRGPPCADFALEP